MNQNQKKGNFISDIFKSTIASISVAVSIYTIKERTFSDFTKYSLYISAIAGMIFIIVGIIYFFKSKTSRISRGDLIMLLAPLIAILLIGPLYYSFGVSIKDFYLWIQSPKISRQWAIPLVAIVTAISDSLLFYFRLKARSFYGLTEAMVGIGVAMQKVSTESSENLTTSNFYLAILTASIYLFVRGLDNIHQGITKEPYDQYAVKIYTKITKRLNK